MIAVIYSNGSQECERVASLLKSLGGEFQEYKLNEHFTQRAFEAEFGKDSEYPQVAIGAKHIGTLKETLNYMKEKKLLTGTNYD
jgi:glutaredoxin